MLDKTFNSKDVEQRIYDAWEKSGAFRAGRRPDAEPYCIVIPPPNVTGRLHIGHALNNALQDILARFERMRGKDVLWQPGTDHAGIATQMIVERQLAERQMSRAGLGRTKFLEEVWKWKEESGDAIVQQQRRLGASADWSRQRFTMDPDMSRAVTKSFVSLYNAKDENGRRLIYKDKRLVNWDPRLQTAVSDLEVENIEMKGHLWYLKYPLADGAKYQHPVAFDEHGIATSFEARGYIVVATTRPETMLGDTAVAVHPEDERYKALVASGAKVRLPLSDRLIPIIADEHSDPKKGTGAVKITPGHDFNDFEVWKRHPRIGIINILNKDGTIVSNVYEGETYMPVENTSGLTGSSVEIIPDRYRGMDRFAARKFIVADLELLELVEKIEPITHAVPHDEKTKTVILEPLMTEQWYLNVGPLADKAIAAVEDGRTKFVPENWSSIYFHWMRNIQPWCISRQLWWGHQIPAWYSSMDGRVFVAETEEEAFADAYQHYKDLGVYGEDVDSPEFRASLKSTLLRRDPDVLDTWFSSALWPFSTLGWPDKTAELARYYPTSVLVTGFDIIFFWVARMMMMGLWFMDDVPFDKVFIHTRVLDEKGAKMSKTKGNVVDPLDLIDEYGADALRFTLSLAAGQGRDMRIGASRVEINRNFATKLWNAARFCEMNGCVTQPGFDPAAVKLTINKWIIGEARNALTDVTRNIEDLRFNEAAGAAYRFVWDVFCDWYLEFAKPLFTGSDEALKAETRATAAWVRDFILKLLHPFMPFITEELWERTAEGVAPRGTMLIEAPWPEIGAPSGVEAATAEMAWVIDLIKGVRSVRAEMNVPPAAKIAMVLKDAGATTKAWLANNRDVIMTLARLDSTDSADTLPKG
ncbi:MAG TPA: valine--tRNA ligase, partial [Rhizomicrobium sp.]